jgi:hypothetical protein
MLRLPWAVAPLFEQWLHRVYPRRAGKVLSRIRDVRAGQINDPNFHSRMRGKGPIADQIHGIVQMARRRAGLDKPMPPLSVESFRVPADEPMLF